MKNQSCSSEHSSADDSVAFTKGPWFITNHGTIEANDRQIASVQSGGFIDMHNAALIAAAPDMYEALKRARDWHNGDPWRSVGNIDKERAWELHARLIDAAIAKAEGISHD